jgi:cobalamin biosynthesis protein CobD/CbiB
MKNFISYLAKLIDSKHSDDSKVFVGLLAFAYVLITGFVNLFTGKVPAEFVFYGILGLVIAVFGLTTYIKKQVIDAKADVAGGILDSNATKDVAKDAKDTLQGDQPS